MADGAGPIDLSTATPPAANICPYAEIVADKARRHPLIEVDTGISARLPALAESERSVGTAYRNVGEGIVGVSTLAIDCMPPKVPPASHGLLRSRTHCVAHEKGREPLFYGGSRPSQDLVGPLIGGGGRSL
ncbi:conserved hypothetical protein [Xanthomonas citri pv. citri]|nr:conserved hypothetical protein [Xanthomonas citri pv. citri]CEE23045.1 conserved hypothetical protein [Xanthomonas citri pv. citri]CEE74075.1 conserved hypothetical protein [Xanthomonas citri pv. citri]CEF35896.1 conserved hypothetical protein [Xanthomonas citri pv. citri]CEF44555.1 conserved hypothetical protein [Xanthomonas citri pv. citri]